MKLIKIFQRLKTQCLSILPTTDIYTKSLMPLGLIALLAEAIWLLGPYITWHNDVPLAQPEKRIYIIVALFLAWLLKFLIVDLDMPDSNHKDSKIKAKLQELQNRFYGALQFLHKTTMTKQGKSISLNKLPWYLLIGPVNAGKTTLLANSNVNFILQRQFQKKDDLNVETSENCDWWVTRDASIIDVPGKYMTHPQDAYHQNAQSIIWQFFLRLIKKQRGKKGVNGIIITLPLPEIMKQNDSKAYQAMLCKLFQQLHQVQKFFPHSIPCQIIITKCDLLPGFTEFFSESNNEDTIQAWGITLAKSKNSGKIHDSFTHRFNMLIKKLNQQLIWRLHQERNPMSRPYVKDFPLQVERTKEFLIDFVTKFSAEHFNLSLQGIYLTSAFQPKSNKEVNVLDQAANTKARSVQIFKEPSQTSRPYFIKQLFTHVFTPGFTPSFEGDAVPILHVSHWKMYSVYAASASFILLVATLLGRDFQQGVSQTYAIQHEMTEYQLAIERIQNPDEHLERTLALLNALQQSVKKTGFKLNLSHLLTFYSDKSQQKINDIYQKALHNILLPEIKHYFEYYLQNPINKNADDIYKVLKAYIMLGNAAYYNPTYVLETFEQIQPKLVRNAEPNYLMQHVTLALQSTFSPLPLEAKTLQETRQYLTSLSGLKLSYIILKNLDKNNLPSEVNLGINAGNTPIFVSEAITHQIPMMFTAKAFTTIFSQHITLAAQEASLGNWVLGNDTTIIKNPTPASLLAEQLRMTYVNNYVDAWEKMLENIHLSEPNNLAETDTIIASLGSTHSPLLQLLQTLRENTYFDPVATSSSKLQNLSLLLEKTTQSQSQLLEIFTGLQALHQYLQVVLTAENQKKAAFLLVANRMLNHGTPDPITQLRFIAVKSPAPVKNWLDKITDNSWRFLMQDAGYYLDLSWRDQVIRYYETDIADRYPFSSNKNNEEVNIQKFTHFFGNPGIVLNFYNHYLHQFIDTTNADWRWKEIDHQKLAFSNDTLRQIQHAMRIHRTFFPHADNKPYIQFALQPYLFGKNIKRIKLNISDKQFIDEQNNFKNTPSHVITWPSNNRQKMTYIQLTMADQQTINRRFPGDWGWFKLINQSFESMITKKEILINFSQNEHPAKYLLLPVGKYNPFMSLNLRHFHLSSQITEIKSS